LQNDRIAFFLSRLTALLKDFKSGDRRAVADQIVFF